MKKETKSAKSHRMGKRSEERKMRSVMQLDNCLPKWEFEEGECYHFLTRGDVDMIDFARLVIRQQYCPFMAISSWIIAGEDIKEIRSWVDRGIVGRVDLFVGEIYQESYDEAYTAARNLIKKCSGRICIVRNHMKMCVIQGKRFSAVIESSANFNTNPRAENCVITIDRELAAREINFLADIIPFNRNSGADPYRA